MNNTDPIQDLHYASLDLLEKRIALHNAVLQLKELMGSLDELDTKNDNREQVNE